MKVLIAITMGLSVYAGTKLPIVQKNYSLIQREFAQTNTIKKHISIGECYILSRSIPNSRCIRDYTSNKGTK